jgi:hypothetical protein
MVRLLVAVTALGVVLTAQMPSAVTMRAQWDPNPPEEQVVSYLLGIDDACCVTVPHVVDPLCGCISAPVTFVGRGLHSVTLRAQNYALAGDVRSLQAGPATTVEVRINLPPGQTRDVILIDPQRDR